MRCLFSILIVFTFCQVVAQPDSSKRIVDVSARFLYSSIWTGREALQQFTKNHPWAVEVEIGFLKNSQASWNYCNCYTRSGVAVGYFNFENPDQLGKAYTLSFFTEPVLIMTRRFSLSLRGSAGFAFLNKVYDSVSNRESIFFSSKLSYYLAAGAKASYDLSKNFRFGASVQFNHISNGGKRDPNEGMNFPGATMSISYTLNPQRLEQRTKRPFDEKSLGLLLHVFGAQRTAQASTNWPEETRYVGGFNFGLIKKVGRIDGIGVGGEFYYDGINAVFQQRSMQNMQTAVGGVSIQHNLIFGKLLFGQQFAWYVTPNTGFQKNIYQRYFLEYELIKNWFAGVTLKAHGDHSDYLAFSVGRYFKLTN